MKKFNYAFVLFFIILFSNYGFCQFNEFITAKDGKLLEGGKEYRFISCNIPNLHYVEDYLPFAETNPWRLPTEFEIKDALTAIKQIGGNVTRIYVISVKKPEDDAAIIRHVEAPGKFNEEAFRILDKTLEIANKTGVRVIIPLVDNWKWWGGPNEYAGFRGKTEMDFWTDSTLISDFKKTIDFVINRKNTYTGVAYKDDKAILAWETGNELNCPYAWTKEIAAYIKQNDKNHLIIDGAHYFRKNVILKESVDDPNIDILTSHHYAPPEVTLKEILKNKAIIAGKKPFFIGEFGLIKAPDMERIVDTIINNGIAGALLWSLRGRNVEGGFYFHEEYNGYSAYHWPGFKSGDSYDEKKVMNLIHAKAGEINKKEPIPLPIPEEPVLLNIKDPYEISWQGSTGAETYAIQRETGNSGNWKDIANTDDATYCYTAQFCDTSAQIGGEYYYRVIASNQSGSSKPSNIVGPVKVTYKKIIDEMEDFSKIYTKEGASKLLSLEELRKAKEDRSRIKGADSSYIIYYAPEAINEIKVNMLASADSSKLSFFAGASIDNLIKIEVPAKTYTSGKNEYGFFTPVSYSDGNLPAGVKYLKIVFEGDAEIGRTEITYGGK